jgi:hypothetical protein
MIIFLHFFLNQTISQCNNNEMYAGREACDKNRDHSIYLGRWGNYMRINMRNLHLGNHGDIFEINEVRFDPRESLLLDFRFYWWEVDISSNCTIIIGHLRWLRIINVNEMLILGLIFDLSELSLINIRNSLIDVLHSNDISFLLIATSHYHSDEKDDCDY